MSSVKEDKVLRGWTESAPLWEKHRAAIRSMFHPVSEALIEAAEIRVGDEVLDLAAGPGEPSLTIARLCAPSGWVASTDAVAPMIRTARDEAQREAIENVRFVQCSGDCLPFREGAFEAAVCRFGIMFFADPFACVTEMLRVVKPRSRLSFAVWRDAELNPFFRLAIQVVARHLATPPADPDAPGAFRFAQAGKLTSLVRAAGAVDIDEQVLQFRIEAPVSLERFWTLRVELSETLREKIALLSPRQLSAIAEDVKAAAREFFPNDRMSFPAEALIVSCAKAPSQGGSIDL